MARTIYEELDVEAEAARNLESENECVFQETQILVQRLAELALPRGDAETIQALGKEGVAMAEIMTNQKELHDEVVRNLEKAKSVAETNPIEYSAALVELLEAFKRLRLRYEADLQELRVIKSRIQELVDESTPKA